MSSYSIVIIKKMNLFMPRPPMFTSEIYEYFKTAVLKNTTVLPFY